MKFRCTVQREGEHWVARHDGPEVGSVQVQAHSREAAAEKIRGELRYRLELCPCTGETYRHIEVELEA